MKYCTKCGKELIDEAVVCTNCGCAVEPIRINKDTNALIAAAKVFMVISTVINGFALLPLFWCLPMTISYFVKTANNEEITVGFKVCTLLFVSPMAGVLMLCDNDH